MEPNRSETAERSTSARRLLLALTLLLVATAGVVSAETEQEKLAKVAQKTNNPVSDAWLLIFQNDLTLLKGDLTNKFEVQERMSFQPVLPVPIFGGKWNLVNRVLPQFFSVPFSDDLDDPDPLSGKTEGIGDTVLFSLFAPNRNDGWIWAVGPTTILPTASEDRLGQEKWQAGPAALIARLGKSHGEIGSIESWNIGALPQHWWSVGGTNNRPDTNQTDIQYFINYKLNATQLIGMTPNIQIDWEKDGSDRFSIPIGIGTIGFFKAGKTPVRWGVEVQYYLNQPDPIGAEWNLKVFIAPVIANPFKKQG